MALKKRKKLHKVRADNSMFLKLHIEISFNMKICNVSSNQWNFMFGMKMEWEKMYFLFFLVQNMYGTFYSSKE